LDLPVLFKRTSAFAQVIGAAAEAQEDLVELIFQKKHAQLDLDRLGFPLYLLPQSHLTLPSCALKHWWNTDEHSAASPQPKTLWDADERRKYGWGRIQKT
jgi:hypothetical protein